MNKISEKCPDQECRREVDREISKLKASSASWRALGGISTMIIASFSIITLLWWNAYAGGQDRVRGMIIKNTQHIEKNSELVQKLIGEQMESKTDITWIKKNIDNVTRNQMEMIKQLKKFNNHVP